MNVKRSITFACCQKTFENCPKILFHSMILQVSCGLTLTRRSTKLVGNIQTSGYANCYNYKVIQE